MTNLFYDINEPYAGCIEKALRYVVRNLFVTVKKLLLTIILVI